MVVAMAACGPKPSPVVPPVSRAAPSAALEASDDASSAVEAGPPATPTSAEPSAVTSGSGARVYCFNWVHQMSFSTDCYRSLAECKTERAHAVLGHRDSTPCEPNAHALCTTLARDGTERCFGALDSCIRYRRYVRGEGLETGDCVNP